LDNISPGALTFRRDMYLDFLLIANILTLADLRKKQIDKHLMPANAKRKTHDYQLGDQVFIKRALDASSKLEPTYKGPYPSCYSPIPQNDKRMCAAFHRTDKSASH
jgi:hypothetical protein